MRFISNIEISLKKGFFPHFINELYKNDCEIHNVNMIDDDGISEKFSVEVVYPNIKNFKEFVNNINSSQENYKVTSVVDFQDEKIKGGLLKVSGKMQLDSMRDFRIDVLGALDLIYERIKSRDGVKYTGISNNIGLVGGIETKDEENNDHILRVYCDIEKDSIIINKFSGYNGIPVLFSYVNQEDFIKSLKSIEKTFSAIKIEHLDSNDISLYEQINSELNIPVVSHELDDIPIYILTLLLRIIKNAKLSLNDTTVGFLGIDTSVLRITRLLMGIGCRRVLGNDFNENLMLSFESQSGLATTVENILSNADVVLLFKDYLEDEDYDKIRPGQYYISLLKNDKLDKGKIKKRGVRKIIREEDIDISILSPGLLKGVIEGDLKFIDDMKIINFAGKLEKLLSLSYTFPDMYSDIHNKLNNLLKGTSKNG
ncbi:hypothetical protein ACFL20_12570 [Spirochaetota bacterium]